MQFRGGKKNVVGLSAAATSHGRAPVTFCWRTCSRCTCINARTWRHCGYKTASASAVWLRLRWWKRNEVHRLLSTSQSISCRVFAMSPILRDLRRLNELSRQPDITCAALCLNFISIASSGLNHELGAPITCRCMAHWPKKVGKILTIRWWESYTEWPFM